MSDRCSARSGSLPGARQGISTRRSRNALTSYPAEYARVHAPTAATDAAVLAREGIGQGCHTECMASLKDRLRADLTASMKARDELRSSTLRMVLTAITNAEVSGKQARVLSDDEVTGVLASERKKRRESAVAFDSADRPELAAKERAESAIIAEFLPEPLSAAEVEALVTAAIDDLGVRDDGMRAMGRVMATVTPQVKGRADGGAVAAEVRRQLG